MSSPGADANFPAMNMIAAQNSANSIMRSPTQSPEWYLGKIIHGNVQPAEISSLTVALRTYELAWVKEFIVTYKGLSALSSALAAISRLPLPLSDHQTKLEAEIAKCVKTLLGIKVCDSGILCARTANFPTVVIRRSAQTKPWRTRTVSTR